MSLFFVLPQVCPRNNGVEASLKAVSTGWRAYRLADKLSRWPSQQWDQSVASATTAAMAKHIAHHHKNTSTREVKPLQRSGTAQRLPI